MPRPPTSVCQRRRSLGTDAGFSLVEALVATAVTAFGVLAVAVLFLYGMRLQANARDATTLTSLAVAQVERIRMLPVTAPERAAGGSLAANVADHFAMIGSATVRWTVADGPACGPITWSGPPPVPIDCTKLVVVTAVSNVNGQAMRQRIATTLWR